MIMPCLGARKKPSSSNNSSIVSRQHSIVNDKFIPTEPTTLSSSGINGFSRAGSITSHQSVVAQIRQECNDLRSKVAYFLFFLSHMLIIYI